MKLVGVHVVLSLNPGSKPWQSCCGKILQVEDLFSGKRTTAQVLEQNASLITQLVAATENSDISLLPSELNTTNNILSKVIGLLETGLSMGLVPSNEVHSKNVDTFIL